MTTLQFLKDEKFGCATTAELIALSKNDKDALAKLKEYARQEMENREIPVTE